MDALQKALDQLDQATAAVRLAVQDLANNAPGAADAASGAAHALSGGAIDPFVFRFAIFVLAI
ncbi:NAD(P) transhydrogenase subunit alpha, partial [Mesorhizobium sp. M2A.F.Ca.ET.039.01.1.1]